ncbi:MAG: hypothetical protein IJU23_03050 [Proteobacteria bacterium]|nr:hypothetical protein [Pseudomonadota bacterium]
MKQITRLISVITGAISSIFAVGCAKPASDANGIYGPLDSTREYQESKELETDVNATANEAMPEDEVFPEFPESEDTPKKIYGPPEMLTGREFDSPKDDDMPTTKYGPLPMPEANPNDVAEPNSQGKAEKKSDDDADSEAQKQDFEMLKKVNRERQEGKNIYGPPPQRKRIDI